MKNLIFPGLALWCLSSAALAKPPNIIFILADDLGWADLSCYGSTFHETPNLDKLAKQGMRFTDAYAACCVCSPSRAAILTGKYPARLHLTDYLPGGVGPANRKLNRPDFQQFLPLDETTVAEALKAGGYKTASIGKWHLGDDAKYYPNPQGFDLNVAGCGMGHPKSYFSPYRFPTLTDGPKGEYLTDRLTDEALKFIEQAKGQPFFLYLPHYAVHMPLEPKPDLLAKYKAKAGRLSPLKAGESRQENPAYAAMLESLDDGVGRIMNQLVKLDLDQNTLILFTSDNGGLVKGGKTVTSNLPLREGKGWPYEGGVREPLIVSWPDVVKPGSTSAAPVIGTDYYATLLEASGLPPRPQQHLDGHSILPVLKGGTTPERPLFWHYPHYSNQGGAPNGVVRLGEFKLIEWYEDMRVELYDLKNDLGEQTDLAAKMPAKADELRKVLEAWRVAVNAQMPTANPNPGANGASRKNKIKPLK